MSTLCAVAHCVYLVSSSIENFSVCGMHDASQVRCILEEGKRPGAYWMYGRPIVLPCSDLDESDFEACPATDDSIHPWEDVSEYMQSIPDTFSRMVLPRYDLTNTDFLGS